MGVRGPVPKRSEERTRRNATGEDGVSTKKGEAIPFTWPAADQQWDKAVKRFYASLKKSGQSAYYQASDANYAWLMCDEINEYRTDPRRPAMKLQAIISMLNGGLLLTEAERRRAHIELEAPAPEVEDELAVRRRELEEQMRGHKA